MKVRKNINIKKHEKQYNTRTLFVESLANVLK